MAKIEKTESEWRNLLEPEQFEVCRNKGTEQAFTGKYNDCKETGSYLCSCCGAELFDSTSKFDSGSGWPSFYQPIAEDMINVEDDQSHSMVRTEVTCNHCDAHLGHVFKDGPKPTGLRYCINSVSLKLEKKD